MPQMIYEHANASLEAVRGEWRPQTSTSWDDPLGADDSLVPKRLVLLAKRILAIRESRGGHLDSALFGEPAWHILLVLYVALGEGYALTISSLCNESGSPPTTALRWINKLTDLQLVRRIPNDEDQRSAYVELTFRAIGRMTRLLEQLRSEHFPGEG